MYVKGLRMFKNIVSLFLISILSIGIIGCNVKKEPTPSEKPGQNIEDNKDDKATEAKNTLDEKLKNNIKIVEETSILEEAKKWFGQFNQEEGAYVFQHPDVTYIKIIAEEKPTGGYGIHIKDYVEEEYPRIVVFQVTEPSKDAVVTQALTNPSVILEIPSDVVSQYEVKTQDNKVLKSEEKVIFAKLQLPQEGDTIGNPVRLQGKIIAFEGAFAVRILDNNDNIIHEENLQADSGGPNWGNFDKEISYTPPEDETGSIEVGEYSAKDGEYLLREKIPVKFKK